MSSRFERRLQFLTLPFLVAASLAALPACQVKYRRDVEKPGTPAHYTYSAGGFMRYDGYDDVAGDLEVASRDYEKPGSGTRIRLAGAIHIGDIQYYRTLQEDELDTADVVLFEGVKFEGEEKPPDLGGVYSALGSILGIGFQKDGINYKARNFVHCDVTVKPGDPLFQTIDPDMVNQAAKLMQPLAMLKTMLTAGGDPRRTEDALKHGMVTVMEMQMGGLDEKAAAEKAAEELGGEKVDEQLKQRVEKALEALKKVAPDLPGMSEDMKREVLVRRNDYVIEQLAARLKADGDRKKQTIAIFYGAAHMPGLERQLVEWGYRPVKTTYFKAWRMNGAGQPVLSETIIETGRGEEPRKPPAREGRRHREPVLY